MANKTAKKAESRKRPPKPRLREALQAAIRERAYQIYLDRGEADEGEMDDWLRAEEEIRGAEIE